ncbi:MAG: carboxy terminal-processing peptidase [Planctomycetaceae bacterium]|nr:carboxy terminal-processing peptidase [Planctomycetaceae bacterium]
MKYPSRAGRAVVLGTAAIVVATLCARQINSADQGEQQTARLVAQMIPAFHLSQRPIDDQISAALVDGYVKELDPQKLYFLQSDVDQFHRSRTALDDSLATGNIDFAFQVFDVYKQRVIAQCEVAHKLIDAEHDFTTQDEMIADPDDRTWATTTDELNERWRQWIKRELLEYRLDDKPVEEARTELHKRYRNIKLLRIDQQQSMDTLETYLTEVAQCFDPHSSYMSPATWENFEISFKLSLDGIGAELRPDDGYTIVHSVVAGGAADKDGRLKPNDKILGVGQATGEIVDIFEMKLNDVVRMIRGKSGSIVRLQVKPADGGETQVYELTRAKIELTAQAVKGEIIETQDRVGRPGRVGLIHVPSFYRDFEGAQGGGDFKSAAADVAQVLRQFEQQGVDVIVVDMRSNGGGALAEAIEMSGLFIDQGPVVQVKDEQGNIEALRDERPGVATGKPVIVLCNRLAASASEIFAGVIKDYHRGLVIGDTTTHGKGTVQNLMDVTNSPVFNRLLQRQQQLGKLKLTIQQFYRVNGDSTQNRGVRSDVVLPSLIDHADLGESFLDNALPFDQIPAARYSPNMFVTPELVALLQRNSEERVSHDKEFGELQTVIARYLERKNRKTVSLNEAVARSERDKETADAESEALMGEEESETGAKKDAPVFPENFYNDEVLNIALDYVSALRSSATAAKK